MSAQPNGEILIHGDADALERWPSFPLYAFDYPALLAQAQESLARRQKAYPEWVRRGDIADDEAAKDIAAWEALVAEWTWIVHGTGELPPRYTLRARRAAIDLSLERIDTEIRRRGGHEVLRQAHLLQAMHWHLHRTEDGEPAVHRLAQLNRTLRADLSGEANAQFGREAA